MRCDKCIHHNICYYEEEVIDPDNNNDCENFEEVRSHGDSISREALKKALIKATYDFKEIPISVEAVLNFIDKAPTVSDRYDEVNEESVKKMARQIQTYCYQFQSCVDCPFYYGTDMCALERPYNYQVSEEGEE